MLLGRRDHGRVPCYPTLILDDIVSRMPPPPPSFLRLHQLPPSRSVRRAGPERCGSCGHRAHRGAVVGDVHGPHQSAAAATGVNGLIVDSADRRRPSRRSSRGVPTVVIGLGRASPQVIDADHRLAEAAMEHLVSLGRRRIAVICGGPSTSTRSCASTPTNECAVRPASTSTRPVVMGSFGAAPATERWRLLRSSPMACCDERSDGARRHTCCGRQDGVYPSVASRLRRSTRSRHVAVPITTVRQPARQIGGAQCASPI
jgi:hypothetical protein